MSISKLAAPSSPPPVLTSGKVMLYRDASWSSPSFAIDTADYESGQRHSLKGSKLHDAATWVAFNLPVGTVMTLSNNLVMNPPEGRMYDLKGLGAVADLVGTGQTEAVELGKINLNDKISMFFWRKVDLSQGALELYQDSDYKGNRTVIFLAEWTREATHSVSGWFISDSASSARWSSLTKTQTAALYQNSDGSGKRYANIKGWGSFDQISRFKDVDFNDRISSFSWSALVPVKEIVAPLSIELGSFAESSGGLTERSSGTNNSSAASVQTVTMIRTDAQSVTVTTTDTMAVGTTIGFSASTTSKNSPLNVGVDTTFTMTLSVTFTYTHTETTTKTLTKTDTLSVTQNFTVPPYSDYQASLTVQRGKLPDTTYTTTAQRWYVDQLPDSVLDPTNNWYVRTEMVTLQLSGMVACTTNLDILATPLPTRGSMTSSS